MNGEIQLSEERSEEWPLIRKIWKTDLDYQGRLKRYPCYCEGDPIGGNPETAGVWTSKIYGFGYSLWKTHEFLEI